MTTTTTTVTEYKSLNDALPEGDTEVWYMRPEHFREGINEAKPDPKNLGATHALLGLVAAEDHSPHAMDELWQSLQGERWSLNGEARSLIRSKGLRHTSMSVGDCFRTPNGNIWLVTPVGFEVVE